MDPEEAHTQSFVVRIWLEETAAETGRATWRGHITHVPSGKRRYVRSLDDIADFIMLYLEQMGVQPTNWRRVRRWLAQRGQGSLRQS